MEEFFRGWKRKTGCVTLLMACVLGMAWCGTDIWIPVSGVDLWHQHIARSVDELQWVETNQAATA